MTRAQSRKVWLLCLLAAIALLIALLTGCQTTRPYTAGERQAMAHAVIGQSLDVATTSMALQDEDIAEGNSAWWDPEDSGSILATKLVLGGVVYLLGEWKPDWRKQMWRVLGGGGYVAAGWNGYLMIKHDVDPWDDGEDPRFTCDERLRP